jgi:hypothetical protein
MRRIVLALMVSSFVGAAAAQVPTSGNVFFGYSYYNTNLTGSRGSLNGWEGSLEGKTFPFIGIVADFSGNYGSLDFPTICVIGVCPQVSASTHIENVLFGPRVSVPVGKFRPFGEAMIGIAHANTNGFGSDTSFSTALGGGLDYRLIRLVAWRFEGDFVRTSLFNGTQHNARISTGIVVHF